MTTALRARRRRDRRRISEIEHMLHAWAAWKQEGREYGWPQESSEVRAFWAAQTASVGPGRDNSVRQGVGIPQCKETRARAGSKVPRIDRARLGPQIDRHLRDMDTMGPVTANAATALRLIYLNPETPLAQLARSLDVSDRTFRRWEKLGMQHLSIVIAYHPRK